MPTSRATARSVTASCEPVRSISVSAADTISSVSRPPWPRAFRGLRAAPEAGPAEAGSAEADARLPGGDFAVPSNDSITSTLHLLAHLSMLTLVRQQT